MNTIIRRDFDTPFNAMNRLMSQLWNEQDSALPAAQEGILPLDISEDDKSIIVRASLPGFKPEEVDVQVHNGILTIKGEHSEEHEEKNERFLRRERRYGTLTRSVTLPSMVDEDSCDASLDHGVLTLRIQKSQAALPRKIKIGGGKNEPQGKNK